MNTGTILAALGSLGGITAFLTVVTVVARAIFKQISATQENTEATVKLNDTMEKMREQLADHETRITLNTRSIEDMRAIRRGGRGPNT